MSKAPCRTMSLITTTLLTAACWLGGCDGSQKTRPTNSLGEPNSPLASLTEAERKYVGVWVVDLPRFAENIKKNEEDKSKPIAGVAYALAHTLAPLRAVVIEPDHSASVYIGRLFEGKWSLRKHFVYLTAGTDFAEAFTIDTDSNVLRPYPDGDGVWWDKFIQISSPSESGNTPKLDGKWILNVDKTNAIVDAHKAAARKYGKPNFPYPWCGSPVETFSVPSSTIDIKDGTFTLQIGNASVTYSFQRKHTVMLVPDATRRTDGADGGLDPTPFIVIGHDELAVQPIYFAAVRDAIKMDSKYKEVNYWSGWIYFKRDTADTKTEPAAK